MIDGRWMGCSDSGPPETYNDHTLSRAYDLVEAIKDHALNTFNDEDVYCEHKSCDCVSRALHEHEQTMINACVPERMRFEMVWTRWQYRSLR